MNMYDLVKIIARIEYKRNTQGRQSAFLSGYRPLFSFPNARTSLSGRIDLIDKERFAPGEIGDVEITFIKGIIDNTHFKVGEHFTFAEAGNPLGEGEITKLVNI